MPVAADRLEIVAAAVASTVAVAVEVVVVVVAVVVVVVSAVVRVEYLMHVHTRRRRCHDSGGLIINQLNTYQKRNHE
jgi:hypothetical protein